MGKKKKLFKNDKNEGYEKKLDKDTNTKYIYYYFNSLISISYKPNFKRFINCSENLF